MMAETLASALMLWSLIAKMSGRDNYAMGLLLAAVAIVALATVLRRFGKIR